MGQGTHHRDRSRTGASAAGHGRRLCGSRQPSAVHRRFRRQSRLGWWGPGFERAEPKETGRPGYDPSDLLKLYIYGYLNRVRSSRRLEAIWLLRRLRPNFKTLADFRQVFRDFVKVCRSLELFGRELIAVDGTRIKAVNSRDRNFTEVKLRRDLAQKITALRERQARLETHRKALQESGEDPLSLTDPDGQGDAQWHWRGGGVQRAGRGGHEAQVDCRAAGA